MARASDPTPADELDALLAMLEREARECKVSLHAWLLLNDRITLLATPPDERSMPRLVQALGRRIAAASAGGRVFAGRYRSALVEPGSWVLPAMVWLESLPAQLHYVDRAESWPWSSAQEHVGRGAGTLLRDHHDYWADGNTPFARQARYRDRLAQGLPPADAQRIQNALFGQWAVGGADFLAHLATRASRRVAPAPRGRPRKAGAGQAPSRA
ncbi:hypothetical protein [Parapusillimonas granuli]|uniref:hypothetical protein n=1 Tax=Parapusillimonas granuli TaxID=380911 RepID=UPI001795EB8A|nr:putative transposase [Parapusillimonas granuli]